MKKRLLALATSIALISAMVVTLAEATSNTPDLSYATLDSMGVLDGFSTTLASPLTRAQFCDMLVSITQSGSSLSTTSTRSPFSDVTPDHWASSQINLVYQLGYLNGNGDGTFAPDRTVSLGEAVTAVLRILGYTPADIGYVWPNDYITAANSLGLLEGISTDSSDNLTYDDGIQLLYAMVKANTQSGKNYLSTLATGSISDAIIVGVDGDTVTLYSGNSFSYIPQGTDFSDDMIGSCVGTLLLSDSGNAVGFVPNDQARTTVSIASISSMGITTTDGATISIPSVATLLMGTTKTTFGLGYYQMEGSPSAVLCYSDTGIVSYVLPGFETETSDSTIIGYYDFAYPNTANPETIQVAGTTLPVADSVSFAGIALGEKIAVTVDATGQVSAVTTNSVATSEYMIGILGNNAVTLINGITISGEINTTAQVGQLVRVTSPGSGILDAYTATAHTSDSLDLTNNTLGSYGFSPQLLLYECVDGSEVAQIFPSDLSETLIPSSYIRYYHLDSNGNVDVILLDDITGNLYDYGILAVSTVTSSGGALGTVSNKAVSITNGEGTTKSAIAPNLAIYDGAPAGLILDAQGDMIHGFLLGAIGEVSRTAFDGTDSVVCNGARYFISDQVQVYFSGTDTWMSLENAKAIATEFELYANENGIIRVILAQ